MLAFQVLLESVRAVLWRDTAVMEFARLSKGARAIIATSSNREVDLWLSSGEVRPPSQQVASGLSVDWELRLRGLRMSSSPLLTPWQTWASMSSQKFTKR